MSEWYYADARRERHGPVEAGIIRDKFRSGELDDASLVWCEGMHQWQPLSAMAEELQLRPQPPAAMPASTGIDLRMDYDAIEKGDFQPPAPKAGNGGVVLGGEIVYAGFWKRVAANFIDSLIVGIAGGLIAMILGVLLGIGMAGFGRDSAAMGAGMVALQVLVNLVSLALCAAYYAIFHASAGMATPGKMAVGIKVVRSNGERITLARGIGRYFGLFLSSLTLCIGYLMAAFTERKQGLHDLVCDTLVVDKWAFTDYPERQQHGLGAVTIVILVLWGLLLLLAAIGIVALIGIVAAHAN